jgi:predicted esterase
MNPVRRALIEAEIALAILRVERKAVIRAGRAFAIGFTAGAVMGALLMLALS